jgi:hypothetical protein
MTDKEIIKILNTATNIDGLQICCIDYENDPETKTFLSIKSDIVDLINRQQAEIEEARIGVKSYKGKYESAVKTAQELQTIIAEKQAEIERLQIRLRKERHQFADLGKMYSEIRAEAIKEFAERLHCHCQSIINDEWNNKVCPVSWASAYEEIEEVIDNLVKEMVGEDK